MWQVYRMEYYSAIKKYKLGLQRWHKSVRRLPCKHANPIPTPGPHQKLYTGVLLSHAPHTVGPEGQKQEGLWGQLWACWRSNLAPDSVRDLIEGHTCTHVHTHALHTVELQYNVSCRKMSCYMSYNPQTAQNFSHLNLDFLKRQDSRRGLLGKKERWRRQESMRAGLHSKHIPNLHDIS